MQHEHFFRGAAELISNRKLIASPVGVMPPSLKIDGPNLVGRFRLGPRIQAAGFFSGTRAAFLNQSALFQNPFDTNAC
jgi:hypothetical protein